MIGVNEIGLVVSRQERTPDSRPYVFQSHDIYLGCQIPSGLVFLLFSLCVCCCCCCCPSLGSLFRVSSSSLIFPKSLSLSPNAANAKSGLTFRRSVWPSSIVLWSTRAPPLANLFGFLSLINVESSVERSECLDNYDNFIRQETVQTTAVDHAPIT